MDANFPTVVNPSIGVGTLSSNPFRLTNLNGIGSQSHRPFALNTNQVGNGSDSQYPFYLFAAANYPFDVIIYSVERIDNGRIKIDFKINCTFPNPPCPQVNYYLPDCYFSPDAGVNWITMTPDLVHPDHDAGPFSPDGETLYTFIWNASVDVPNVCVIDKFLVRIEVTDGIISNSRDNGIGSTDDFINVVYGYPENDKIYIGFIVNTFDTNVFCLESVEWSRDGINWSKATNSASDPANSTIPRQTHKLNVWVWDWQKDTTDANNTCIKFNVYKLGATEPEITRIPQIRLDRSYSNGVGEFYDGWLYAHGGGDAYAADIKEIHVNDGTGRGYLVVHDSRDIIQSLLWVPGFTLEVSGTTDPLNNGNKVISQIDGDTIYFTTTFNSNETYPANTCVVFSTANSYSPVGNDTETFFRVNPTTFEVEYNHIKCLTPTSTHQHTLDKDGQPVSISKQFSQSHGFLDKNNGNWILVRGTRENTLTGGAGTLMQIMYWNFEKKFWKVLFRGKTGYHYPSNQQAATWVHDGWFYWLGGYQLGQSANAQRPAFFRINIDSMYTGNVICEDLLPNTTTTPGFASQPVNQYCFGTWFTSLNPVTLVGSDIYAGIPNYSGGWNSFARYDCRACLIPNTNGQAIIPGGSCNTYWNPKGVGIWYDSLIYDPNTHTIRSIPLPNEMGSNGFRLYPQNGAVVMMGGSDLNEDPVLYTYDPCFDLWRDSVYPTGEVRKIDRPFGAFDEANNQWYTFGGAIYALVLTNIEGKLVNYINIQKPPTEQSGTKCNIYTNHSDTWTFGPGEELPDFNTAMEAMVNFFHGQPLPGDQFLLGTGGPYRNTRPLNFNSFKLNTNGYKLVIASKDKDNRLIFTGDEEIPQNTFLKYIEPLEPKEVMKVWKSDWLKCQYVNSTWVDIYENGKPLEQKWTLAEVEDTPGSYFIDTDYTLYLHASDSSQVRINHLKFEATTQNYVFKWDAFDENDKCKGITFIDLDINHSNNYAIQLRKFGNEYDSFDGATILNCRIKSNYGSVDIHGAIGGVTIKNNSFISEDNDRGEYSGHVDLSDVKDNIVFTQNYLWQWGNGELLSISAHPLSTCDVNDNIFVNGDYPTNITCDDVNFKRNIIRAQNLNRPTYECLFGVVNLNYIGNAVLGTEDFHAISLYGIPSVVNVQNNTFWTDRGTNETIVYNVNPLTELNFRLNLVALHGTAYDDATLGMKEGNVYLVANGAAPIGEFKSRIEPWRNVFARPFSYTANIDAVDIIPSDSIAKNVRRKIPTDPQGIDITGANTPCQISAGCIQAFNEHGSYKVESFRWLPLWVNECSMPDNVLTENFYKLPNRKRTFSDENCIEKPKLIVESQILRFDNFIGTSVYNLTVSLDKSVAYPVSFTYQTADGSAIAGTDYVAATGTVTFAPFETTKTIPSTIIGDGINENEENFFINYTSSDIEIVNNTEVLIQDSGIIADADYLVLRYTANNAAVNGGIGSNTFISDPYSGNEVGWNDPYSDGNKLTYGGDGYAWGVPAYEEVVINVNNINKNIFKICSFLYWMDLIGDGNVTIEVRAYKGGTMNGTSPFMNTGGVLNGTLSIVRNITKHTPGLSDAGEYACTLTYDKTTKRLAFGTQNLCQTNWIDDQFKLITIPMGPTGGLYHSNYDFDKSVDQKVYFKFTPTITGNYYIRTKNATLGFEDSMLDYYGTDDYFFSTLDADDDYYGGGSYSRIPSNGSELALVAGVTYYFRMNSYGLSHPSGWELDVQVVYPVALLPVFTSSLNIFVTAGQFYSYQIAATNSPTSFGSSGLPAGWSMNINGVISGISSDTLTTSFQISATNEYGTTNQTVNITWAVP